MFLWAELLSLRGRKRKRTRHWNMFFFIIFMLLLLFKETVFVSEVKEVVNREVVRRNPILPINNPNIVQKRLRA